MSADAATLEPFAGRSSPAAHAVRPYLWSVRREVWENRTAVIAPAVAAAVVLAGFLLGLSGVSHWSVTNMNWRGHSTVDGGDPGRFLRLVPYFAIAVISMITAFIAAAFYCLGALHNERRDRTILFWKSLPVSDLIAVGAKATLPLVVIPLVVCVVVPIFQGVMLLASAILAAARPDSPAAALASYPLLSDMGVLVWGVFTQALWYAPVWGWLFLVSAWARRAPFLWAVGVPIAASIVERMGRGFGRGRPLHQPAPVGRICAGLFRRPAVALRAHVARAHRGRPLRHQRRRLVWSGPRRRFDRRRGLAAADAGADLKAG